MGKREGVAGVGKREGVAGSAWAAGLIRKNKNKVCLMFFIP